MNHDLGIKERARAKPQAMMVAAVALIILAAIAITWTILSNRQPAPPTRSYYSIDDGKSWFADTVGKIVPFDHNGQPAVLCHVVSGPNGKVCDYLEKYSDAGQKALMKTADANGVPTQKLPEAMFGMTMVKRAGDAQWSSIATAEGHKVTSGPGFDAVPVLP